MSEAKKCILHIGMHKTGSSSIQEYLGRNRSALPEGVVYADLGANNHSGPLLYALRHNPAEDNELVGQCESEAKLLENAKHYSGKLAAAVATDYQTIIFSAESLPKLSAAELKDFRELLYKHVQEIEVFAYLREPLGYVNSAFQQIVKTDAVDLGSILPFPNYRARFEKFEKIFGTVNYALFHVDTLFKSDVVYDFCDRYSLPILEYKRVNESLGMLAVKFLMLFQRVRVLRDVKHKSVLILENALSQLDSTKFEVDTNTQQLLLEEVEKDIQWIRSRLSDHDWGLFTSQLSMKKEDVDFEHFSTSEKAQLLRLSELADFTGYIEEQTGLSYKDFLRVYFIVNEPITVELHLGYFDGNILNGWAINKEKPYIKVQLDVHLDGKYITSIDADKLRNDLLQAGLADGKLSFSLDLAGFFDGRKQCLVEFFTESRKLGEFVVRSWGN